MGKGEARQGFPAPLLLEQEQGLGNVELDFPTGWERLQQQGFQDWYGSETLRCGRAMNVG
jgi:hypothetical protein